MTCAEDRYVFYVEWFDAQADLIRRYMLTFFPRDNTIEMYDHKNKRPFLKRSEYPGVSLGDLYLGAKVTIHSRQLKVIEYGDVHTRKAMEASKSRTLALIKPDAYNHMGKILSMVHANGFVVARLKMVKMAGASITEFLSMGGKAVSSDDAAHLGSDVIVAMELIADAAISKWQALMGPESPDQARSEAPRSIRAMFGQDVVRNAVYGSGAASSAEGEIDFFFGDASAWPTTALFNNCTLCIVRPHAFTTSGGEIVDHILTEGFEISAMRLWYMDKATAEEFLEVYKGVLPEYHDMVGQLCTGPSLVLEVRQENAVDSFRKLVGPHDPEGAKHLRPATLRAKFGIDRVKNAMHCTDLPEDGLLEVEYFFNILYGRSN
jgi:nucleoside-diphosphate kinase